MSEEPSTPSPSMPQGPTAWEKVTAKRIAEGVAKVHNRLEKLFARLNEVHDELGDLEGHLKELHALSSPILLAATSGRVAASAFCVLPSDEREGPRPHLSLSLRLPTGLTKSEVSAPEVARAAVGLISKLVEEMTK